MIISYLAKIVLLLPELSSADNDRLAEIALQQVRPFFFSVSVVFLIPWLGKLFVLNHVCSLISFALKHAKNRFFEYFDQSLLEHFSLRRFTRSGTFSLLLWNFIRKTKQGKLLCNRRARPCFTHPSYSPLGKSSHYYCYRKALHKLHHPLENFLITKTYFPEVFRQTLCFTHQMFIRVLFPSTRHKGLSVSVTSDA